MDSLSTVVLFNLSIFALFLSLGSMRKPKLLKSEEYLIYFGVMDDVDENTVLEAIDDGLKRFAFTAADWFHVICMALDEDFENYSQGTRINIDNFARIVEFICADNVLLTRSCATTRVYR